MAYLWQDYVETPAILSNLTTFRLATNRFRYNVIGLDRTGRIVKKQRYETDALPTELRWLLSLIQAELSKYRTLFEAVKLGSF